jgi:hypothetical protein
LYPKLYTLVLSRSSKLKVVPNEPYIPFAEDIELSYSATETAYHSLRKDSEGELLKSEEVQMYHEDASDNTKKKLKPKPLFRYIRKEANCTSVWKQFRK